MRTLKKLLKGTNTSLDIMVAVATIILFGLSSNFLIADSKTDNNSAGKSAWLPLGGKGQSYVKKASAGDQAQAIIDKAPVFTARMTLETPNRRKKVPGKAVLEKIEVVDPNRVPDHELLGSYTGSTDDARAFVLRKGGKALKMTFSYINEGDYTATYDSRWSLQGKGLEDIIASFEDGRFTYAYGQVPMWSKISSDPVFYESHILKPGQKVTETIWFFPCPPVRRCLIGDFELARPIEIELP